MSYSTEDKRARYSTDEYGQGVLDVEMEQNGRARLIRRTYTHLAGAVAACALLDTVMLKVGLGDAALSLLGNGGRFGWLGVLGIFMVISWMSRSFAAKRSSVGLQYVGLGLYVVAYAVLFLPLLAIAQKISPGAITNAGIATLALFCALTAVVFITRKDFSFLRSFLAIGGIIAIGLIICAAIFGFTLGLLFSAAMVVLASAAILYDTSKILHEYEDDEHVAAAFELFASVALLFWYLLRIFMSRD